MKGFGGCERNILDSGALLTEIFAFLCVPVWSPDANVFNTIQGHLPVVAWRTDLESLREPLRLSQL